MSSGIAADDVASIVDLESLGAGAAGKIDGFEIAVAGSQKSVVLTIRVGEPTDDLVSGIDAAGLRADRRVDTSGHVVGGERAFLAAQEPVRGAVAQAVLSNDPPLAIDSEGKSARGARKINYRELRVITAEEAVEEFAIARKADGVSIAIDAPDVRQHRSRQVNCCELSLVHHEAMSAGRVCEKARYIPIGIDRRRLGERGAGNVD